MTSSDDREVPFVEPVRATRTFETAIENIIAGIEHAHLRQGDRLPTESDLARQLAISKPTLRQALRVLERSGLLLVKQGKSGGIFLQSDYLPTDAISSNIATEERHVVDALRGRRVLEGAITHEAMHAATADDFAQIERTVELLLGVGIGSAQVLRADMMFHRAVAQAAHNRVLEAALQVVHRHIAPVRDAYSESTEEAALVHQIHRLQLDAMMTGDDRHLDEALDFHFHFLEDRFATSIGRDWTEVFGPTTPALTRTRAAYAATVHELDGPQRVSAARR